jgi:uncharacterized OB-fold protein
MSDEAASAAIPTKALPPISPESEAYWQGCRDGKLLLQSCAGCGHIQFYPRLLCTACGGEELGWHEASGNGAVKSFTIIRRAVSAAYEPDAPYVVALIELAEGPTMMSNVVDCDVESVAIGMPVQVSFEAYTDRVSVPVFKLSA